MQLSITTTYPPAIDLGYLLRTNAKQRPSRRDGRRHDQEAAGRAPADNVSSARCASESALGIEALERFVAGEPLYRVHECGLRRPGLGERTRGPAAVSAHA